MTSPSPSSSALIDQAIECATLIRCDPLSAYAAIATAEGLDAWFTSGSEVDSHPGGRIRMVWKNWGPDRFSGEDGGPILIAEPGRCFSFQWHEDSQEFMTTVRLDFERQGEYTIVRLSESGYPDTPKGLWGFMDCSCGWGEALTLMKMYLEHGVRY